MDQVPSNNLLQATFRVDEKSNIVFDYSESIKVYPNPSRNVLFVERIDANGYNDAIELIDLQGRVLKTIHSDQAKVEINISELSSGIYTLKVGARLIKFVVEK